MNGQRVCLLFSSSSCSESPFSEPGALEEAEPDAGTETQTSDEGTPDPWPSHNRPHSHPAVSWWRAVATATATMEIPPATTLSQSLLHTQTIICPLASVWINRKCLLMLFSGWSSCERNKPSEATDWQVQVHSIFTSLIFNFPSSSLFLVCLPGRGWGCGGGGEVRLRGPVGPWALLQEGSIPAALPESVTWLVGGTAQRQPWPGASPVHRGEGQASVKVISTYTDMFFIFQFSFCVLLISV